MKKLTFEEVKKITFGAIRIEESTDGIRFYRCTPKQTAAWASKNPDFGDFAESGTGVRLDFHTNSQRLSLSVGHEGKYEVYINGLLRAQYELNTGDGFSLPLGDPLGHPLAEKRVTVYFPCHKRAILTSVELDIGAELIPHTYDFKMLCIGDSITQGWAAEFDSLSYVWRVGRHFNADIVNQGVGGTYYFDDAFDHIPFDPDVITVSYGTNDFSHYKTQKDLHDQAAKHLSQITKTYAGKKIFIITPIWRGQRDGKQMGSFEECRAIIAGEAEKLDLIVIDGLSLVPPLPVFFSDEYLHPNDCGMSLYAENLIIALEKYLK